MSILVRRPEFAPVRDALAAERLIKVHGRVAQVVGLVVESNGPNARVGDLCWIEHHGREAVAAEVVGFRGDRVLLMPLGETTGVRAGCLVRTTGEPLRAPVGMGLLGRVVDALGRPIDGRGPIRNETTYPTQSAPPGALERKLIQTPFVTGVRAIDGMMTLGQGQRLGIFAGSGVGKSTLLGMIARNGLADANVIALVGERGREVREFIINDLGVEGLKRSVVVVATSDEPALLRIRAALTATAMAEFFRDQGLHSTLMMDSVTRFAMAQREVGLAIGEPPSTKGYTPSVFALLPRLMERAGCGSKGAITALYTILVEGDDTSEPIADAARSILDGHLVLSRKLVGRGHYPPIDVLQSLSRLMPMVTEAAQVKQANRLRELLGAYDDVEDLVAIGAYKEGTRPVADEALRKWEGINAFLRQDKAENSMWADTRGALAKLTDG